MATDFAELTASLGFLVGDSSTDSLTNRKRCINDALVTLLGHIRAYWRLKSVDLTSVSTPALVDGTYAYNLPSDFESVHRLYYRESGAAHDVDIVSDAEWLEESSLATQATGAPRVARITRTSGTQFQLELSPRVSGSFISSVGTLTISYYATVTRLVADADEPLLPENLRHLIVPVAGVTFAIAQGDAALVDRLRPEAERARLAVLKHDLTRTGRPRMLRPNANYLPAGSASTDYGG